MPSLYKAVLTGNILTGNTLTEPIISAVRELLEKNTFACLRGWVDPQEVANVKNRLRDQFKPEADQELDPARPDLIRQNYQRLFTGRTGKHTVTRPRLLRTFYNPLWDRDIYGCHDIFRKMIALRNWLCGLPAHFAADQPEQGLWTAARIHHYPRGGGFMAPHRDEVLSEISSTAGLSGYYQVILLMSKKGLDYQEGGAYLEIQGERVFFEEIYEPGDLVVYDSRALHGVEEIDPREKLDLRSLAGRLAAFVSLYRLL